MSETPLEKVLRLSEQRIVRTQQGAKKYGDPVGTPIIKNEKQKNLGWSGTTKDKTVGRKRGKLDEDMVETLKALKAMGGRLERNSQHLGNRVIDKLNFRGYLDYHEEDPDPENTMPRGDPIYRSRYYTIQRDVDVDNLKADVVEMSPATKKTLEGLRKAGTAVKWVKSSLKEHGLTDSGIKELRRRGLVTVEERQEEEPIPGKPDKTWTMGYKWVTAVPEK